MAMSEPPAWTAARNERMQAQFPQLAVASPRDILDVDAYNIARGHPPTAFSMRAMQIANYAAQQLPSSPAGPAPAPDAAPGSPAIPTLRQPGTTLGRSVFR